MVLNSTCANHPREPAIAICQHCKLAICYRDVNKLYDRNNSQEYDLCLSCYKESQQNRLLKFLFLLIIFLIPIVFLGLSLIKQDPSGIVFILVIVLFIFGILFLFFYLYINDSIKEATERYQATNINGNDLTSNNLETGSRTHLHSHKNDNNPELQQEVQNYVSWLFSGTEENNDAVHITNTSLNHEQNSCPMCGTIYESTDVFCSNCGHQRESITH